MSKVVPSRSRSVQAPARPPRNCSRSSTVTPHAPLGEDDRRRKAGKAAADDDG